MRYGTKMGSKTKYYTDLQVNSLFEPTDELFAKAMVRAANKSKSLDPTQYFPIVLQESNLFYQEKVFDAMGVNANITLTRNKLTNEGVAYYIATNEDPNVKLVTDFFYSDSAGRPVDMSIHQVYDSLTTNYYVVGTCEKVLWQELNDDRYEVAFPSVKAGPDGLACIPRTRDYADKSIPDTQYVNGKWGIWLFELNDDCTIKDVDNPIFTWLPTDTRAVMATEYTRTDDSYNHIFIFESDVTKSADNETALIIPFMKNGSWVESNTEVDFILSRFGLNTSDEDGDSMKSSMEDAEHLKHSFITYSLDRSHVKYGHWVDIIYGRPNGSNNDMPTDVSVSGDYNIQYRMRSYGGYTVTVERESKNADAGSFYIIPTGFLKKQGLRAKVEIYQDLFNMWMYSENKVKIKWYQTTAFRIIFTIVAAVFLWGIGAIAVQTALTMVATTLLSVALQNIDPRLAAIIGVAIAIISFNPANALGSTLAAVNSLITAYNSFAISSFEADMTALNNSTEEIGEDTEEMRKQIEEMWHQGINIPLDTLDYFSDPVQRSFDFMEMSYNQSDMIEIGMANMTNIHGKLT